MSGFLDAECVVDNLVDIGFIKPAPNWMRRTSVYDAIFYRADKIAIIKYEITVVNGVHRIPESTVRLHQKQYSEILNIDFSIVFTRCVIPDDDLIPLFPPPPLP